MRRGGEMKGINKTSAVLIAVILAAVASLAFLIVKVTALFIAAYVFTLFAIAAFLCGNLFLLSNTRAYPWGAALPYTAAAYLAVELVLSALAIVLEQGAHISVSTTWFTVAQCVTLAVFAIRVITLNAGRVEIERVEEKVKANTVDWKTLAAELEALSARAPVVKPVLEAVKYSDPVTSPALTEYDAKLREDVAALANAVNAGDDAKAAEFAAVLRLRVKDRNNRARLLK
jgi:hypothetical protein